MPSTGPRRPPPRTNPKECADRRLLSLVGVVLRVSDGVECVKPSQARCRTSFTRVSRTVARRPWNGGGGPGIARPSGGRGRPEEVRHTPATAVNWGHMNRSADGKGPRASRSTPRSWPKSGHPCVILTPRKNGKSWTGERNTRPVVPEHPWERAHFGVTPIPPPSLVTTTSRRCRLRGGQCHRSDHGDRHDD